MNISYDMLTRFLERCEEVIEDQALPAPLRSLYVQRVAPLAATYRAAGAALLRAEDEAAKERSEVRGALAAIAQPYRFVSALVAGHAPDVTLPEGLGGLRTDTDKKLAIEALLHRIDASHGEPWADELAQNEFVKMAPDVIREIDEDVQSRAALSRAIEARSQAFGPASDAFVAFRAAVRAGCGPASAHYRRLAPRHTVRADAEPAPSA